MYNQGEGRGSNCPYILLNEEIQTMFSQLQSNHRGNSQRFREMLMSRLNNLCRFSGQKQNWHWILSDWRQRKRHTEKLTSVNL